MSTAHEPLVPLAERPHFQIEDHRETVRETLWSNPTSEDQILELYTGAPRPLFGDPAHRPKLTHEQRKGTVTYVIRAGQKRALPSEFDYAIQQTICHDPECAGRPLYCRDRTHKRTIMGGLGPRLINEGMQHRPVLHPALDAQAAAMKEAMATAQKAAEAAAALKEASRVAQSQVEQIEERLTEPSPKTNASGMAASPKKEK